MKIELLIKEGSPSCETRVTLEGYAMMVEHLLEVIKKAAQEYNTYCEIK